MSLMQSVVWDRVRRRVLSTVRMGKPCMFKEVQLPSRRAFNRLVREVEVALAATASECQVTILREGDKLVCYVEGK